MVQKLSSIIILFITFNLISVKVSNANNETVLLCGTSRKRCYEAKLLRDPMTWTDATEQCRAGGGTLPGGDVDHDVKNGRVPLEYINLLDEKGKWTSHVKMKSGVQICFIHKVDKHGRVRKKKSDCIDKHSFVCLYPSQKKSNSISASDEKMTCPSESWVQCPEPEMKVHLGEKLQLSCEHRDLIDSCEWRIRNFVFRSSSFSLGYDPRVSLVNNSCELTIPVIEEEDIGEWQCQGHGSDFVSVNIVQNQALKHPVIRVNGKTESVARIREKEDTTITCEQSSRDGFQNMEMVLMSEDESRVLPMTSHVSEKQTIIGTSVLSASDKREESMLYNNNVKVRCIIQSKKGNSSHTAHLNMSYEPRIDMTAKHLSCKIGQRLEYTLRFRANPKPTEVYVDIITASTHHMRLYPGQYSYMQQKYELRNMRREDRKKHEYGIDIVFHQLQVHDSTHNHYFVVRNEEGEAKAHFKIHYESSTTNPPVTEVAMATVKTEEEGNKNHVSGGTTAAISITVAAFIVGCIIIAVIYTSHRTKRRYRKRIYGKIDENCNQWGSKYKELDEPAI